MKVGKRWRSLSEREALVAMRFRFAREQSGLSQESLAECIEFSRGMIANVEAQRVSLKFPMGWRFCRFLDLRPRWLADGTGDEHPFLTIDWDDLIKRVPQRSPFNVGYELIAKEYEARAQSSGYGGGPVIPLSKDGRKIVENVRKVLFKIKEIPFHEADVTLEAVISEVKTVQNYLSMLRQHMAAEYERSKSALETFDDAELERIRRELLVHEQNLKK